MTNEELQREMTAEIVAILDKYGRRMAELKRKHEQAAQSTREDASPTWSAEAS